MTSKFEQQRIANVLSLKEFFGTKTNDQILEILGSLDRFLFYFENPKLDSHQFKDTRDDIFEALLEMVNGNLAGSLELAKQIHGSHQSYYGGASFIFLAGRLVTPWVDTNSYAAIFFVEKVLPRLKRSGTQREIEEFKADTFRFVRTDSARSFFEGMGLEEKFAQFYGVEPISPITYNPSTDGARRFLDKIG
jgi:hypothetical protein